MLHSVEVDLGSGRVLTLESGKMAKQANGAVIIRSGESVVLVTACTAPEPKPNARIGLGCDMGDRSDAPIAVPRTLRIK